MRLIVGLGNPGARYKDTRHNIGFMTVDSISRQLDARFKRSILLKGHLAKKEGLLLAKPSSFMNLSGLCVKKIVDRFKVGVRDLLIICDDFNLPFGKLRLRGQGSSGGHNGLSSIADSLKTEDFARLRVGIGSPQEGVDAADFVLSGFSETEKTHLVQLISRTCQCALEWASCDIESVMAKFN